MDFLSQVSFLLIQVLPWVAFVAFIVFMPDSAKTRIRAKFLRSGVLVTLCTPDGFEKDMFMKVDMKYGLFTHRDETYIFTPQPKYKTPDPESKEEKELLDVPENVKKNVDEAINNRTLTDTGKAHYIGLTQKGIAVTPALLKLIKEVNSDASPDKVKLVTLITPQDLSTCISQSFSQSALEYMRFSAEERGFLRRPMMDALQRNKVSIVFLLLIVIAGYMVISGKIDLGRLFGKYLGDTTTSLGGVMFHLCTRRWK